MAVESNAIAREHGPLRDLYRSQGFKNNVRLRALRPKGPSDFETAPQHHIYYDEKGAAVARRQLTRVDVGSEVRGYWDYYAGACAFSWELCSRSSSSTGFKRLGGNIGFQLRIGQRFWREHRSIWNGQMRRWESVDTLVALIGCDPYDEGTLVLQKLVKDTQSPSPYTEVECVPINKFLADFDPNAYLRTLDHRNLLRMLESEATVAPEAVLRTPPPAVPFPWAFSIATIWKMKRQFMPLLHRARHALNRPGGAGYKRAREEFKELADGGTELEACGELLQQAHGLFTPADWAWVRAETALEDSARATAACARIDDPWHMALAARIEHVRRRVVERA